MPMASVTATRKRRRCRRVAPLLLGAAAVRRTSSTPALLLLTILLVLPSPGLSSPSHPPATNSADGSEPPPPPPPPADIADDDDDDNDEPARPRKKEARESKKQILSLGGNGMIGSSVLTKLIDTGEYDITLVSRGRWPFDTSRTIRPFVNWIQCDRSDRGDCDEYDDDDDDRVEGDGDDDGGDRDECFENAWLNSCPQLVEAVARVESYHAVLDFSGYEKPWVEDAVAALGDGVRVYVYVSSDSVYEVCYDGGSWYYTGDRGGRGEGGGREQARGKNTEERAVRPVEPHHARNLAEFDPYGHEKLGGEEALRHQRYNPALVDTDGRPWGDGFPHVSLRFADVVGPRDGTHRYGTYHVWAKYVGKVDGLPDFLVRDDIVEYSSITYVEDAAWSIIEAMERPESWDEAYNIASEEIFNVTELLPLLGTIMGRDPSVLGVTKASEDDGGVALYPSVTRGPIDVTKARERLGFRPTPLRRVLEETVEWYDRAFLEEEEVRTRMVEEFIEDVLYEDDDDYDAVVKRLWEAVNADVREAASKANGTQEEGDGKNERADSTRDEL